MKRPLSWLLPCLLCASVFACGGGEKKTDGPRLDGNPEPTAKVKYDGFDERATAHLKKVVKIIESNKDDCSALGQRLNDYVSANSAFLKKLIKSTNSIEAKEWKTENDELVRQFNGSYNTVVKKKCGRNSNVKEFEKAMMDLAR